MDTNQPTEQPTSVSTTQTTVAAVPAMLKTKMPSTIAFAVGILLFFLPFSEIKCGGSTIMSKSGLSYSMGSDWKSTNALGNEGMKEMSSKTKNGNEGMAQVLAIAALALGILGLALCFSNVKPAFAAGTFAGVLAASSLIGLMFEVKKWFKKGLANDVADKISGGGSDFENLSKMQPALAFTTWFYIAIIAFLAAAFFCYKRMSVK